MEYERSIFRMHERLLLAPQCGKFVTIIQRSFCCLFIYLLIAFIVYHRTYVSQSDILTQAIEE